PRDECVFRSDEDKRSAASLLDENAERLSRRQKVASCEHCEVELPVFEARLRERRTSREAGRSDEDVEAAVCTHSLREHPFNRNLIRDVNGNSERTAKPVTVNELVGDLTGSLLVAVGDNDMRAELRQ